MRLPRFTTLQLLLITTMAALVAGLFTSAWRWQPVWVLADIIHSDAPAAGSASPLGHFWVTEVYTDAIPIKARAAPMAAFIASFAVWAVVWGIVRKRGRESLAKNGSRELQDSPRQRLPTPSAPLAMKVCWGVMVIGGMVALGIPIVLMFTLGPLLFPTIYFSLFVGLAAIARGAARDSVDLRRTAELQLANMVALDPANVVFAAMELALLNSRSVREYLTAENR
jgi:hypothetical protein